MLFDEPFKSAIAIRGSKPRCYRMPAHTLINISHGARQTAPATKPIATLSKPAVTPSSRPPSDGHANHKKRRDNCLTEVHPDIVDTSTSSGDALLLSSLLGSPLSVAVPPMPSCEYLLESGGSSATVASDKSRLGSGRAKQKSFIARCDKLFVEEAPPKPLVRTFSARNCIPEYSQLFAICQQSGINDPRVIERHEGSCVYMSFHSSMLSLPEAKEVR